MLSKFIQNVKLLKIVKYIHIRYYYVGLILNNTPDKTDSKMNSRYERKMHLKLEIQIQLPPIRANQRVTPVQEIGSIVLSA